MLLLLHPAGPTPRSGGARSGAPVLSSSSSFRLPHPRFPGRVRWSGRGANRELCSARGAQGRQVSSTRLWAKNREHTVERRGRRRRSSLFHERRRRRRGRANRDVTIPSSTLVLVQQHVRDPLLHRESAPRLRAHQRPFHERHLQQRVVQRAQKHVVARVDVRVDLFGQVVRASELWLLFWVLLLFWGVVGLRMSREGAGARALA